MTTYVYLNLAVLAALGGIIAARPAGWRWRSIAPIIIALLVLTAVFDSVIVAQGIVAYDSAKILGVYVGRAPVEDFAYALAAAIIVPFLWEKFK